MSTDKLTYQLPTQACWSHTLCKPPFKYATLEHATPLQFKNEFPRSGKRSPAALFKWLLTRKSSTWPTDAQDTAQSAQMIDELPQERPDADINDWKVWFVGHATVLLQIGPYNFLTDPVWCEYVSPLQGHGPQRACPAGMALEQLPTIHAILLSHNHYDHMDLATLNWLHDRFAMPIYTGLGNRFYLPDTFNVIEMEWWQSLPFDANVTITYTPAQHGSGRGLRDQNKALWGGFSLLTPVGHCFFAGDTGYAAHFKEICARFGPTRIALLPIGAYEPRQLMKYVHMNPQDALKAHADLQSKHSLAIHYRTFQLTDEARDAPETALHELISNASVDVVPFYCIREGDSLAV